MAAIVVFGVLTACNILGVSFLSGNRGLEPEGEVIVEVVTLKPSAVPVSLK